MTEPSTDDKIQLLVRSVLEAVDTRLESVRHEVATFAAEVERRHHQLLGTVDAMERRLADLERADARRGNNNSNVTERLDDLSSRLDLLARAAADTPTHGMPLPDASTLHAAAPHDLASADDLAAISKPLIDHSHPTTQVPIVQDPSVQRLTGLPIPTMVPPTLYAASPPPPAPATPDAPETDDDEIDLEQLSALLTERLGHLGMPQTAE